MGRSISRQLMTLPLTLLVTFALVSGPGLVRSTPELTVALGNAGVAPVSARTFAADVYTLVNGGFGIGKDGDPVAGPTTWLDYPADSLDLVPNQRIERTFSVSIPADTAPGHYITGIVIEAVVDTI